MKITITRHYILFKCPTFTRTELVTASPLLYSTLKLIEQWESTFVRRLEAIGPAPDDLFGNEEDAESPMFRNGPPIMRHKSILEQDHSPFCR